jgi:hypothetical protein
LGTASVLRSEMPKGSYAYWFNTAADASVNSLVFVVSAKSLPNSRREVVEQVSS